MLFYLLKYVNVVLQSSWLSAYNQNTGPNIQHPKSTPSNLFATSKTNSRYGWKIHTRTVMQKNTPISTKRYGKTF